MKMMSCIRAIPPGVPLLFLASFRQNQQFIVLLVTISEPSALPEHQSSFQRQSFVRLSKSNRPLENEFATGSQIPSRLLSRRHCRYISSTRGESSLPVIRLRTQMSRSVLQNHTTNKCAKDPLPSSSTTSKSASPSKSKVSWYPSPLQKTT